MHGIISQFVIGLLGKKTFSGRKCRPKNFGDGKLNYVLQFVNAEFVVIVIDVPSFVDFRQIVLLLHITTNSLWYCKFINLFRNIRRGSKNCKNWAIHIKGSKRDDVRKNRPISTVDLIMVGISTGKCFPDIKATVTLFLGSNLGFKEGSRPLIQYWNLSNMLWVS